MLASFPKKIERSHNNKKPGQPLGEPGFFVENQLFFKQCFITIQVSYG